MYDEGTELSPELIELMQKVGGQEYSRLAFEQLVGPPKVDVVALTLMQKTASVTDLELFKAAERACPGDPIQLYEQLGGQYKLGAPDEAQQRFDAAYDDVEQTARPIARGTMLGGAMLGGTIGNRIGHAFTDKPAHQAALSRLEAAEAGLNEKKAASVVGRAKGIARVGELLSGSRATGLREAKTIEEQVAKHTRGSALKHDASKVPAALERATGPADAIEKRNLRYHAEEAGRHHSATRKAGRLGKVLSAEEGKVRAARGAAGATVGAAAAGVAVAHHKDSDK